MRSSRRPGVATTMSGDARERDLLPALADAAVDDRVARRRGDAVGRYALGDLRRELARGRDDERPQASPRGPSAARRWRIGRTNAAVLPVPVCAQASTSRPASTCGMTWAWTGVGWSYPSSSTARTSAGTRPSAANGEAAVSPSSASGVGAARTGAAWGARGGGASGRVEEVCRGRQDRRLWGELKGMWGSLADALEAERGIHGATVDTARSIRA